MIVPGTLAPKLSEIPSFGWMWMTQAIGLQIFYRGVAEQHEGRAAETG